MKMESVFSNFTKKTWLMLVGIAIAGAAVFGAAYIAAVRNDQSQSTAGLSIETAPQSGDEIVQDNLVALLNDDSRQQYNWTNTWTGASGSIQILRVATTEGGIICKEYQIVSYAPETGMQKNVACQDGNGGWTFD